MAGALLHERFPELVETLPHIQLSARPTSVRLLEHLSDGRAPVWLKDDGAFGEGGCGGSKVRKLEWLLPDVRRRDRRTIVTLGGLGTNCGLATALYAREYGLATVLALYDQPVDDHVAAQFARIERSPATLHRTRTRTRAVAALPWLLARHADGLRPPYLLAPGGSSPVGVLGYVDAALEIAAQVRDGALPAPSHIVVAVSSGGTAAGMLLGLRLAGLRARVVAVLVNDTPKLGERVLWLARRSERLLRDRGANLPPLDLSPGDVTVVREWLGPGYGHRTPAGERAREVAEERVHLELDPVYTAKAMAALLAMNAVGEFGDGPVLFLRTNGPH